MTIFAGYSEKNSKARQLSPTGFLETWSGCKSSPKSEVEAAGIEPAYGSSQLQALQELTRTPDPVAAYLQLFGGTDSHSLSKIERDLKDVLLRWPQLPDHIRQVIMTLVRQS